MSPEEQVMVAELLDLSVRETWTEDVVKRKARAAVQAAHPDRGGSASLFRAVRRAEQRALAVARGEAVGTSSARPSKSSQSPFWGEGTAFRDEAEMYSFRAAMAEQAKARAIRERDDALKKLRRSNERLQAAREAFHEMEKGVSGLQEEIAMLAARCRSQDRTIGDLQGQLLVAQASSGEDPGPSLMPGWEAERLGRIAGEELNGNLTESSFDREGERHRRAHDLPPVQREWVGSPEKPVLRVFSPEGNLSVFRIRRTSRGTGWTWERQHGVGSAPIATGRIESPGGSFESMRGAQVSAERRAFMVEQGLA